MSNRIEHSEKIVKTLVETPGEAKRSRLRVVIRGAVQGVGFRPFIFRLAADLALTGWVSNSAQGVCLEVEGPRARLQDFLLRIEAEKPSHSFIQSLEASWLEVAGYRQFEIRPSDARGAKTALVMPDIATCSGCLGEIFDPTNRRYLYPFTNCTHCGPRFSIITALPFDRANTSMKGFTMCARCRAEYEEPTDRRFQAQPNACPDCGPHLEFRDAVGARLQTRHDALRAAARAIRAGEIVAVKGLGGFHIMTLASDEAAVRRLRQLKGREEKPFAVMFPSLRSIRSACEVSALEERLLRSAECPIVLLQRTRRSAAGSELRVADSVAPGNPLLGAMLPYTPLHHLLMAELGVPAVATSGNLSDEPICIDEQEAAQRLGGIARWFLVHNRPIVRHVDDSIVRVMAGRELVLRRARGYAPLPVQLPAAVIDPQVPPDPPEAKPLPLPGRRDQLRQHSRMNPLGVREAILAVGAHLKNTVALATDNQVFLSQHIGDLETAEAFQAFQRAASDLARLYDASPARVAADLHPEFLSTRFARDTDLPLTGVQHHYAHVLACMAENELAPPVLGVCWDGTGYGLDGTIWGGEFLCVPEATFDRVACLRPFPLPGGDRAAREPRRSALGLLYEWLGPEAFGQRALPTLQAFTARELTVLERMLGQNVNAIRTSSVGRLFDAVASLIGLRQRNSFEGQSAMELEFAAERGRAVGGYDFEVKPTAAAQRRAGVPPAPAGEVDSRPDILLALARSLGRRDACPTFDPRPLTVDEQVQTEHSATAVPAHEQPTSVAAPQRVDGRSTERTTRIRLQADWSAALGAILADVRRQVSPADIAAKFHLGLAELIVNVARHTGIERIALTGGCFQNRFLTEQTIRRLRAAGFAPHWHQRIPPNDGGIALGQVIAVLRERR